MFAEAIDGGEYVPGFILGLWNGFTFLYGIIASLASSKFTMFEARNSGFLYNIGFVLGQLAFLMFLVGESKKKRDNGGGGGHKEDYPVIPPVDPEKNRPIMLSDRSRLGDRSRFDPSRVHFN